METLKHNSSNHPQQSRQRLLDVIHQLPDRLVQEVVQFTDYLVYREGRTEEAASPSGEPSHESLPEGKSTGYQKLKASGLIGFGEAEANLSETYKGRYAEEIAQKYDHR